MYGLSEISDAVNGAQEEVGRALREITDNFGDVENWKEMSEIEIKLVSIKRELENIFPQSLIDSINEEGKYQDEMSDMADANGY